MSTELHVRSSAGFFFFQAEDGIRDDLVTGVQTCALPILTSRQLAISNFRSRLQLCSVGRDSHSPWATWREVMVVAMPLPDHRKILETGGLHLISPTACPGFGIGLRCTGIRLRKMNFRPSRTRESRASEGDCTCPGCPESRHLTCE